MFGSPFATPAPPRPIKTYWLVAVRHGNGWRQYPMEVLAMSDLQAARDVRRSWGKYKLVRVKSAEMPDKWRRFRFK